MILDNNPRLDELLRQYFEDEQWEISSLESGVNNTTRFVSYQGSTYVLRVYDNHTDVNKVNFEMAVLEQLQSYPLSFRVPKPVKTLIGENYGRLPSGKIAALFHYIEGERANLGNAAHVYQIGKAAAELVAALSQVRVEINSAYEPYYELYQVHPLVTKDKLNEWIDGMLAGPQAREAEQLRVAIDLLEANLLELKRLPVQLVHSDLVGGNMLASDDRVSGVLDFEFVTPDLRVMEAAVFLSELIRHHSDRWELIEAFVKGYSERGRLDEREVESLPQLILLRSLVLCIHFLGRHWAIGDQDNPPESFLSSFAEVHAFLDRNKVRLTELCRVLLGGEQG